MTVRGKMAALLSGMGSAVDVFGVDGPAHMEVLRGQAADREAIASDWTKVGDDIRASMERFRAENLPNGAARLPEGVQAR
jgi:hypothetical protein